MLALSILLYFPQAHFVALPSLHDHCPFPFNLLPQPSEEKYFSHRTPVVALCLPLLLLSGGFLF